MNKIEHLLHLLAKCVCVCVCVLCKFVRVVFELGPIGHFVSGLFFGMYFLLVVVPVQSMAYNETSPKLPIRCLVGH